MRSTRSRSRPVGQLSPRACERFSLRAHGGADDPQLCARAHSFCPRGSGVHTVRADDPAIRLARRRRCSTRTNGAAVAVLDRLREHIGSGLRHAGRAGLLAGLQAITATGQGRPNADALSTARVAQYGDVTRSKRRWHGIAVALLMRAHQYGIDLQGVADPHARLWRWSGDPRRTALVDAAPRWTRIGGGVEACSPRQPDAAMLRLNEYLACRGPPSRSPAPSGRYRVWGLDAATPLCRCKARCS